jgi:hypothetical protein
MEFVLLRICTRIAMIACAFAVVLLPAPGAGADLHSEVQLLLKSPDAGVSGNYVLPCSAFLVEALMQSPLVAAHLWEAYGFGPHYRISMRGNAIHVDDPTGIQGDVCLAERSPNRRVYYCTGSLNHAFVPAFRGKMALVITTIPKPSGVSARVDVYIRADSRILGVLTRTFSALVRSKAEHRITFNVQDFSTILHDLSAAPQQTAARLKNKDEIAFLTKVLAEAR